MTGLLLAEVVKLHSRASARGGLLFLALVALLGPVLLEVRAGVEVTGNMVVAPEYSAANAVRWALGLRSFYVAQAFLILLAAQSYAGELQAHTLREDLVRPVRRVHVLLAKWAALAVWSFLSVAVAAVASGVVGLLLHPSAGEVAWGDVLLGHAATWVAEVGFAAVALAVSVAGRSVAVGIAGMFLFVVIERMVGWALWALHGILASFPPDALPVPPEVLYLTAATPWLPSSAWGVGTAIAVGEASDWQSWAALALWTGLAAVLAERVFARTDVP